MYDTSQVCSQTWCQAQNYDVCAELLEDYTPEEYPDAMNWETCECDMTPILISLEPEGSDLRLTDILRGVHFDLNADGHLDRTAWTHARSETGFLALDRNGDGIINDGGELFGTVTPQPRHGARNGFNALGVFDAIAQGGNGDGVITEADEIFTSLRIWIDADHDGFSQSHELRSLKDSQVVEVSLDYKTSRRKDDYRNEYRYRAPVTVMKSGKPHRQWAVDVVLRYLTVPVSASVAVR